MIRFVQEKINKYSYLENVLVWQGKVGEIKKIVNMGNPKLLTKTCEYKTS